MRTHSARTLPVGFDSRGRRTHGFCPLCRHHGTDCDCTIAEINAYAESGPVTCGLLMHTKLSAVDDLLAFAKAFQDMAVEVTNKGTSARPTVMQLNTLYDQSRAAIAKAEGSQ